MKKSKPKPQGLDKAAPDLLQVLEDIRFAYDHKHDSTCREEGACIWVDVDEAIAKEKDKTRRVK